MMTRAMAVQVGGLLVLLVGILAGLHKEMRCPTLKWW